MTVQRWRCSILSLALGPVFFLSHGHAHTSLELTACPTEAARPGTNLKITNVTVCSNRGLKTTQLQIELQNAPNGMEPVSEPRLIRVDDRANVQFLLLNLSPLDLCTRTANAPTPTAETNVAESLVTTIAGLFGAPSGAAAPSLAPSAGTSSAMATEALSDIGTFRTLPAGPKCDIQKDPEYTTLIDRSEHFFPEARDFIRCLPGDAGPGCAYSQVELARKLDNYTRDLAGFAAQDYRGTNQSRFKVAGNDDLTPVGNGFTEPLPSITGAGRLQAIVDEIAAWDADLHKKYDFKVPAGGDGAPTLPKVIAGALTVAPASVGLTQGSLTKRVKISAGQAGTFTATATSDTGWLLISGAGGPSGATVTYNPPAAGFFELMVAADPTKVSVGDATTHKGTIAITGAGGVSGAAIDVTFNAVALPSECDLEHLARADRLMDRAKAMMSLISDNNKTLQGAQTSLKTAYMALLKVEDDFKRRKTQLNAFVNRDGVLVQPFNLATDRKDTSTGYLACVSALDGKTPTTTNINYTLLYQDVPHWTASAGLLTSFVEKRIIGLETQNIPPGSSVGTQYLVLTDHAPVQVVPMAYANYRILPYHSSQYGKGKEDQLVWTLSLSGGFGVNPNTGTNQPEFFAGLAAGLNRFMVHLGCDWGRMEQAGGGYTLNYPVPGTLTTAPIAWHYYPKFTAGFSVRVAPY